MREHDRQRPKPYLVAKDGQLLRAAAVPAVDSPETPLDVSFVGITEAEQRAALAAFPGGRRFRLKLVSGG